MVVIGAKGFAKELLELLVSPKYNYNETNLFFFDDVSSDLSEKLFGKYKIISSLEEVEIIFKTISNEFSIGIGTPKYRKQLCEKFENIGGEVISIISESANIGSFDNKISKGVSLMSGAVITNGISIGKGVLININSSISHDTIIEDFVEITPGCTITGHCKIGTLTFIGTGANIIPNITIGRNCIIGAGTVVTKDVPDNSLVVGVPGKVIKSLV